MTDVFISYTELKEVDTSLKQILEELQEAQHRQEDLEGSIGRPYGQSKLRDRAHDFEGGWDDRRNKLIEDIGKVEQHLAGVLDGFENWDTKTSQQLTGKK